MTQLGKPDPSLPGISKTEEVGASPRAPSVEDTKPNVADTTNQSSGSETNKSKTNVEAEQKEESPEEQEEEKKQTDTQPNKKLQPHVASSMAFWHFGEGQDPPWDANESDSDKEDEKAEVPVNPEDFDRNMALKWRFIVKNIFDPMSGQSTQKLSKDLKQFYQNSFPDPRLASMVKDMIIQGGQDEIRGMPKTKKLEFEGLKESVPYHLQGDPDLHTAHIMRHRRALKEHPKIVQWIHVYWQTFCKNRYDAVSKSFVNQMSEDDFVLLEMKIAKALYPVFNKEHAERLARRDWKHDSQGLPTMDVARFSNSIFELVDIWTVSLDVEEYIAFFAILYSRLTIGGEDIAKAIDSMPLADDTQVEAGADSDTVEADDDVAAHDEESDEKNRLEHSISSDDEVKAPEPFFDEWSLSIDEDEASYLDLVVPVHLQTSSLPSLSEEPQKGNNDSQGSSVDSSGSDTDGETTKSTLQKTVSVKYHFDDLVNFVYNVDETIDEESPSEFEKPNVDGMGADEVAEVVDRMYQTEYSKDEINEKSLRHAIRTVRNIQAITKVQDRLRRRQARSLFMTERELSERTERKKRRALQRAQWVLRRHEMQQKRMRKMVHNVFMLKKKRQVAREKRQATIRILKGRVHVTTTTHTFMDKLDSVLNQSNKKAGEEFLDNINADINLYSTRQETNFKEGTGTIIPSVDQVEVLTKDMKSLKDKFSSFRKDVDLLFSDVKFTASNDLPSIKHDSSGGRASGDGHRDSRENDVDDLIVQQFHKMLGADESQCSTSEVDQLVHHSKKLQLLVLREKWESHQNERREHLMKAAAVRALNAAHKSAPPELEGEAGGANFQLFRKTVNRMWDGVASMADFRDIQQIIVNMWSNNASFHEFQKFRDSIMRMWVTTQEPLDIDEAELLKELEDKVVEKEDIDVFSKLLQENHVNDFETEIELLMEGLEDLTIESEGLSDWSSEFSEELAEEVDNVQNLINMALPSSKRSSPAKAPKNAKGKSKRARTDGKDSEGFKKNKGKGTGGGRPVLRPIVLLRTKLKVKDLDDIKPIVDIDQGWKKARKAQRERIASRKERRKVRQRRRKRKMRAIMAGRPGDSKVSSGSQSSSPRAADDVFRKSPPKRKTSISKTMHEKREPSRSKLLAQNPILPPAEKVRDAMALGNTFIGFGQEIEDGESPTLSGEQSSLPTKSQGRISGFTNGRVGRQIAHQQAHTEKFTRGRGRVKLGDAAEGDPDKSADEAARQEMRDLSEVLVGIGVSMLPSTSSMTKLPDLAVHPRQLPQERFAGQNRPYSPSEKPKIHKGLAVTMALSSARAEALASGKTEVTNLGKAVSLPDMHSLAKTMYIEDIHLLFGQDDAAGPLNLRELMNAYKMAASQSTDSLSVTARTKYSSAISAGSAAQFYRSASEYLSESAASLKSGARISVIVKPTQPISSVLYRRPTYFADRLLKESRPEDSEQVEGSDSSEDKESADELQSQSTVNADDTNPYAPNTASRKPELRPGLKWRARERFRKRVQDRLKTIIWEKQRRRDAVRQGGISSGSHGSGSLSIDNPYAQLPYREKNEILAEEARLLRTATIAVSAPGESLDPNSMLAQTLAPSSAYTNLKRWKDKR